MFLIINTISIFPSKCYFFVQKTLPGKVLCVALIRDRIGHGFFSSLVTNTRYPGTLVPGIYF